MTDPNVAYSDYSRCCHKIIFPAHQFGHIILLSMLPAWAFTFLLRLIEACLHCQCSLRALFSHYLNNRGRFSFFMASAEHSDKTFVSCLTLHRVWGRKFPWHMQTHSLFSVKYSEQFKRNKIIPGLPPCVPVLLPSQHQLPVSFCSSTTRLSHFVFPGFSPQL